MDDEILSKFYEFVHSRSKRTYWRHHFILTLIDEVVRLREKYEGFVYKKIT